MTHIAQAPQPSRASNSFVLAWGSLIQIPLSVYGGVVETRVSRKEFLFGTEVPIGRASINKNTGEVVDAGLVERKALATNGTYVPFSDDEIAAATCPKGQAEIVAFVPVKEAAQYLTEGVVQVRPKSTKGKADPHGTRAFALFAAALRKTKTWALVKIALRGPARYGLLTPEGDLLYIYTADAIREPRPVDTSAKFSAQELGLAITLIEAVGISAPIITDDTAEAVQAAVDAKAGGKPAPIVADNAQPTQDLLAALQASLGTIRGKGTAA